MASTSYWPFDEKKSNGKNGNILDFNYKITNTILNLDLKQPEIQYQDLNGPAGLQCLHKTKNLPFTLRGKKRE